MGCPTSSEGSLDRLGVDRLDFVVVHDPAQDIQGDPWLAQLETARPYLNFRGVPETRPLMTIAVDSIAHTAEVTRDRVVAHGTY